MRILLAARLSQLKDGQTGIETQDEGFKRWAEGEGHIVVDVAADRKSGTVQPWHRPKLRPWVYCGCAWCREHNPTKTQTYDPDKIHLYDAVGAYRLDRLSRGDNASTSEIEEWARVHGKKLLTEDGLIFPCEGVDGIRWDITKRLAHEEWLKISERYRRMQGYLKSQDMLVSRPPYGYIVVPKGEHKTLAPHPDQKLIVIEIFSHYLKDGWPVQQIADELNARGVPSPKYKKKPGKFWHAWTVNHMLHNPIYTGRQVDASGKTILRVEPVILLKDFRAVQDRLASRAHRKGAPPKNSAMLTSSLHCAKCHGPMYRTGSGGGTVKKNGPRKYAYYCRSRKGCKNMLPLEEMDSRVSEAVIDMYGDQPHRIVTAIAGNDHSEEMEQLKLDLAGLDPITLGADWLPQATKLQAEIIRISELDPIAPSVEVVTDGRTVAGVWNELDADGRRRWLIDHGWRIEAARDETGEIIMTIDGGELDDDAVSLSRLSLAA